MPIAPDSYPKNISLSNSYLNFLSNSDFTNYLLRTSIHDILPSGPKLFYNSCLFKLDYLFLVGEFLTPSAIS